MKRKCNKYIKVEHIIDMITLKKSMDRIIEEASNKNIRLMVVKDKSFKKILDGI